jgi:hypothetical protein
MNNKILPMLVVAFPMVLIPNIASAFYAPHMGRFTSRDPVAQSPRIGGKTPQSPTDLGEFVSRAEPRSRSSVVAEPRVGYVDGFNLYNYVHNMPNIALDPSGAMMVCCGDVRGNSCERSFRHCELTNGQTGRKNEKCYPVWQDNDCKRKLDDGTPCCKATAGQIAACFKRHPYSAGSSMPESNCQQSTVDTIGSCCLKSTWQPNWYANPDGSCLEGYWISIGIGDTMWICTKRAFPACKWQSGDPPGNPDDDLPPF